METKLRKQALTYPTPINSTGSKWRPILRQIKVHYQGNVM